MGDTSRDTQRSAGQQVSHGERGGGGGGGIRPVARLSDSNIDMHIRQRIGLVNQWVGPFT